MRWLLLQNKAMLSVPSAGFSTPLWISTAALRDSLTTRVQCGSHSSVASLNLNSLEVLQAWQV